MEKEDITVYSAEATHTLNIYMNMHVAFSLIKSRHNFRTEFVFQHNQMFCIYF